MLQVIICYFAIEILYDGISTWPDFATDEKGSIMEAVDKGKVKPTNGVSIPLHAFHSASLHRSLNLYGMKITLTIANTPIQASHALSLKYAPSGA